MVGIEATDGSERVDERRGGPPRRTRGKEIEREMVEKSTGLGSVTAHLYRGEMERTVEWRSRLDTTTNWAVTVMSAIVAYDFSGEVSHAVILAGLIMNRLSLHRGAAIPRLRHLALARQSPPGEPLCEHARPSEEIEQDTWRKELSEDYRDPVTKISYRGAFSHRLRRVYLPLTTAMLLGWIFHIWSFNPDEPFLESAALPGVDGTTVVVAVAVYYVTLLVLAIPLSSKDRGESGSAEHGDLEE